MGSPSQRASLLLTVLTLLSIASAQSTSVIKLALLNDGVEASVVAANPSLTTYKMGCPSASPSCLTLSGLSAEITAIEGPSTLILSETILNTPGFVNMDCKITGTTEAACVETASIDGVELVVTTTFTGAEVSYGQVTVTGGLDKLAAATGAPQKSGSSNAGPSLDAKMAGMIALLLTSGLFVILL